MPSRRRSALVDRLVVDQPGRPQQAILDELRRVILDGAVPPGTAIPLADVADLFGVSQIPVRESLKTLIGEGLVSHRSNAGYAVAQLTPQELREMYIVRETLESASLAAAIANANDEDRAAVVAANDVLQQAIRDDDPVTFHRQSRNFHLALTRPSRMHRLLHMLEVGLERHRTGAVDGACRAGGPSRAARRPLSDARRVRRWRRRAVAHGRRAACATAQRRHRNAADRYRAAGVGRYIFGAIVRNFGGNSGEIHRR